MKRLSLILLLMALVIPFQNCSNQFQALETNGELLLSSVTSADLNAESGMLRSFAILVQKSTSFFQQPVVQRGTQKNPAEIGKLDRFYARSLWDGRLTFVREGRFWGFRTLKSANSTPQETYTWKQSAFTPLQVLTTTNPGKKVYYAVRNVLDAADAVTEAERLEQIRQVGLIQKAIGIGKFIQPSFAPDPISEVNPVLSKVDGKTVRTYYLQMVYTADSDDVSESIKQSLTQNCLGFLEGTTCHPWGDNLSIGLMRLIVKVREEATGDIVEYARVREVDGEPIPAAILRYTDSSGIVRPVVGIESSFSFDAKLVLYKARVIGKFSTAPNYRTIAGSAIAYVSRADAKSRESLWAPPRSLADPNPALAKLYPIFRKPLRYPDGKNLAYTFSHPNLTTENQTNWSQGVISGSYPWISPDGTDVYFTSLLAGDACVEQAGYAVVGQSTNYIYRMMDGGSNWARGVYGLESCLDKDKEGKLSAKVSEAYAFTSQTHLPGGGYVATLNPVKKIIQPSFIRQFSDSPMMKGTAWDSLTFADPASRLVPYSRNHRVDIVASATGGGSIGEVDYDDATDGSYLLFWHMNELVTGSATSAKRSMNLDRTPDSSGNLRNGIMLNNAVFSHERRWIEAGNGAFPKIIQADNPKTGATEISADQVKAIANDYAEGFSGQSVSFKKDSCMRIDSSTAPAVASSHDLRGFTYQSWMKLDSTKFSESTDLLVIPGTMKISIFKDASKNTVLNATLFSAKQNLGFVEAPILSTNTWQHIAVRVTNSSVGIFLDGKLIKQTAITSLFGQMRTDFIANFNALQLGPCGTGNLSGYAMTLDEVSMSALGRHPNQILAQAYRSEPKITGVSSAAVTLGDRLFHDTTLSKAGRNVSCATCHVATLNFHRPKNLPTGISTDRSIPGIGLAALYPMLMWDGSAGSLEAQVALPLENPKEHNTSLPEVLKIIKTGANRVDYQTLFTKAFGQTAGDNITDNNLRVALAEYIRSLALKARVSGNGLLLASAKELPVEQLFPNDGSSIRKGFEVFRGKGRCTACHSGVLLTDRSFHDTGMPIAAGGDLGRSLVTGAKRDQGRFKTPSLWDVGTKANFFHDGRFTDLRDVVNFYDRGGDLNASGDPVYPSRQFEALPLGLSDDEKDNLITFLKSLRLDY